MNDMKVKDNEAGRWLGSIKIPAAAKRILLLICIWLIAIGVGLFLYGFFTSVAAVASILVGGLFPMVKRQEIVLSLQGPPALIDTNGDYVRACRMNDGSLVAGYTRTSGDQKILLTAKSTDDGASWRPLGEVFRGAISTHEIDNAFPLQLPGGRLLYAYRNHDKIDGIITWFRVSISYSDDRGVTFKYLSTVDERAADGVNGLWEPFLRIARDGSLQCYYSSENNADDQDGHMRISRDGGMTWGERIVVSGEEVLSRDGMIGCAETGIGDELMCVFEATPSAFFVVDSITSPDDGLTWTNRQRRYTANHTTSCQGQAGAPQIINVGGTLILSFTTNEDHNLCNGYDGGDMKVIISTDGGRSWGEEKSYVVGAAPVHWAGLLRLGDERFLALFGRDGFGAGSQEVVLT